MTATFRIMRIEFVYRVVDFSNRPTRQYKISASKYCTFLCRNSKSLNFISKHGQISILNQRHRGSSDHCVQSISPYNIVTVVIEQFVLGICSLFHLCDQSLQDDASSDSFFVDALTILFRPRLQSSLIH